MTKWQYKVLAFSPGPGRDLEKDLNAQGEKGWEVVSVVPRKQETATSPGVLVAVLKREAAAKKRA